jgi:hypothetical protein
VKATAEAGFVRTPLVLRHSLKTLFTMPLRRSHNVLPTSSVGLIRAFFSVGSIASPLAGRFDLRFFLCRVDHASTGREPLTWTPSRPTA